MFFRKSSKVADAVAEATRKYDDQARELAEKQQAQAEKVNLAIRFRQSDWLFKREHLATLTGEEKTKHQLEDHTFLKEHHSLHHRAYRFVKHAIFPPKARQVVQKVDGAEHFARKREHNKQLKVKFDLINEALWRLNKPKMPAHHEDALYMPGHAQSLTPEHLKFQEDYLIANRPIANPPGVHLIREELRDEKETAAMMNAQNGDAYLPGSYHKYFGADRIYGLKSAPATIRAIFRFSEPKLRETSLLPDRNKEAKLKLKKAKEQEYLLRPFYRFRKQALDLHRKPVAVPRPENYYPEEARTHGHGHHGLGVGFNDDASDRQPGAFQKSTMEHSTIKHHGPPTAPAPLGYSNTRPLLLNQAQVACSADTRKERFYAVAKEHDGSESEVLTWTDLDKRRVVDGPESMEITREYRRRHKSGFDREEIVRDIEQKFIVGVEKKSRFEDYYPHHKQSKKKQISAYDEFGNRIINAFNFHSESFDEVSNPGESWYPLNEGIRSASTDPFIKHYPSITTHSSSASNNNLHASQYLAGRHNPHLFVNDNDTHNASRASDLSINSVESRYHVPVKMQKHRHFRGLSRYRIKSGFTLISKRDRHRQGHAREEHRERRKEQEEIKKFLESRNLGGGGGNDMDEEDG